MKLLQFINRGARTVTLTIEGYMYVVAHGQIVTIQRKHAPLAKGYGLEVIS